MEFIIDKKVKQQLAGLMTRGGHYQRAAETVKKLFGDISLKEKDPFKNLNKTNHGETRVKNVVKYDLNGFCRLITIQKEGRCIIKFLGDHDACNTWLNGQKGLNIGIDEGGELKDIYLSEDINSPEKRLNKASDYSSGNLINKLSEKYLEILFTNLPLKLRKLCEEFDSLIEDDDIIEICELVQDGKQSDLLFDTIIELRSGDVDVAKNRILFFQKEIKELDKVSKDRLENIKSNDSYLRFDDMEPEDLKILMDQKSWYEWMLFMHPAQREVVNKEFSGPARLLGVSGSGKTAIIVKRAVRLAQKYENERVLILTLNRSLSKLISNLIEVLIKSAEIKNSIWNRIFVKSYWEYCRECLINFSKDPLTERIYNDTTDRHEETIDAAWLEFYECKNNNDDAKIILDLHKSLLSRDIYPQKYIKQELDWIRSAFERAKRNNYLEVEREGRTVPLTKSQRQVLLELLNSWERQMKEIGITDYLGMSQDIMSYENKLKDTYRSVLVDEVQDFGTIELEMIRNICKDGENDLFICGDIAQVVQTKHHKITHAGINIAGQNYMNIEKNYRNSREILSAAYSVFEKNTDAISYEIDGFKILKPEYANFSTAKPFLRKTSSVKNGFNFSIRYLKDLLNTDLNEKGCIAICGYSYHDILKIGKERKLPVLNGMIDISEGDIFLSDLENTKGFEFDIMIIVNCNKDIIPNPDTPEEEWFREVSKFYVAMTRAKKELIISYNQEYSSLLDQSLEFFTKDVWTAHLNITDIENLEVPDPEHALIENAKIEMNGLEYVYSRKALGLSIELQNKLIELVDGTSMSEGDKPLSWKTIGHLRAYLSRSSKDVPHLNRLFGRTVYKELMKEIA